MTETNVNTETQRVMKSGRKLLEELAPEETYRLATNGFYKKLVEGKTREGNRKFSGYQYRFIPVNPDDAIISITATSAGGKMIARQEEEFREQFPDKGELGHYQSVVEFKHVTHIKDRETGQQKEVDFLSVQILPETLGKRVFTPSGTRKFKFIDENTENNYSITP